MGNYLIKGGKLLSGEIAVKGAKNHVLKMLPASILIDGKTTLNNVPSILDVQVMVDIINSIGGKAELKANTVNIDPTQVNISALPADLVVKMRASFLFIIPLLIKTGEVVFPHPGGDAIGRRPIDMTLDFLNAMGAEIIEKPEAYHIKAKSLKAINYTFKWISVTGTEAIIMAAVKANGLSVIKNVALEPEVIALCEYLNSVGAKIEGIGTTTLKIEGVKTLNEGVCEIIPDRIEAGTFAILGALCGQNLKVTNCEPDHLDVLWKYFDLMGIKYNLEKNSVTISKAEKILPTEIKTHEYPGFPTDLQPPMVLLMTQAEGLSMMHETIYDGRLFYTDKLNAMGANIIMADPHRVIIQGPTKYYGKFIGSPDVRAGITLVMAGLIAQGQTEVTSTHHIERGYEQIVSRLQNIGCDIIDKG